MSAYIELHCHSHFSLLDGASSPEELVKAAAAMGMKALALTDHDAVYGIPRFVHAAREANLQPLIGAELTLSDGHHLTLLVRDAQGWHNLCWLITAARHNAPKGHAALAVELLKDHTQGLVALSGCRKGFIPSALLRRDTAAALAAGRTYRDWFGGAYFWIELQNHLLPEDRRLNESLVELARNLGVGYVATNNVHYATRDRHMLQDVLVCIHNNTTLDECSDLRPNAEFALKSYSELLPLFEHFPDALSNSLLLAEQYQFELPHALQPLPLITLPAGSTADTYLKTLCVEAARKKKLAEGAYAHLDYELSIIRESGLSNYFLVVWDIVRFAREQGIRCQGRGSAANSLVAYLLGISPISPLAHNLVFERFLSAERKAAPDIDIDFDAERREEVIQYIYDRYGLEHAAMASTFVTFGARSAVRDIGKALGLPLETLNHVTTTLDVHNPEKLPQSASVRDALGQRMNMTTWQQIMDLAAQIDGFPRHLGIHNGGMVVCGDALTTRVPTEPASMNERYVTQWDKEALEDTGMLKVDILGLRMLSALSESAACIRQTTGKQIDLDALTFDDPAVYDMICAADTVGVFQVESRAQAQVLPRLKPRTFADLIVSISLIRPGPVMGDMVHPYLRRRFGEEKVAYLHDLLRPALEETPGVILVQEQVLKIARDMAGFTAGQGELLRRALGSKRPAEAVEEFYDAFIQGAMARGADQTTAEHIFDRLRAFGGYSFPKSHAAAFAVVVYQSAWLKRYYPAAFYLGLLNNQPMGFWSPAILVNDARRHGLAVRRVDINKSEYKYRVEGGDIRLGFSCVNGFGEANRNIIAEARGDQPFADLKDFTRRVYLPRRVIENLIAAGAMDGWKISRRELLWSLGMMRSNASALDLDFGTDPVQLPKLTQAEQTGMEYSVTGISTGPHVLAFYRKQLKSSYVLSSKELNRSEVNRQVKVAGMVVVHQSPPTAKGYHFLTLEDEHGFMNIIIRPKVYSRYWRIIRRSPLLLVDGIVQRQGDVTNLIARRFQSFN